MQYSVEVGKLESLYRVQFEHGDCYEKVFRRACIMAKSENDAVRKLEEHIKSGEKRLKIKSVEKCNNNIEIYIR